MRASTLAGSPPTRPASPAQTPLRGFGVALVAIAAALSAWLLDQGLGGGDEGCLLASADRILAGQVFYRELDAYAFPGAPYLLALGFHIFGAHLGVSRVLAALLFCVLVACLYGMATRVLTPRRAALFGICLLGMKLIAWPIFTVYSYYDLAFVGACGALLLLLSHPFRRPSAPLFGAGLCVGVALVSKQNVGLYLGAVVCLWILLPRALLGASEDSGRRLASLGVFAAGAATVALPFVVYFAAHGLFVPMLTSSLLRPLQQYLPTSGISFGLPLRWWELGSLEGLAAFPYFPITYWMTLQRKLLPEGSDYASFWLAGEVFVRAMYTALPVALAGAVWLSARAMRAAPALECSARAAGSDGADRSFVLLTLGSLAVVASAFPRADFTHLISVYPLVLLLLFAVWDRTVAVGRPRAIWLEGTVVGLGLVACIGLAALRSSQLTETLALDRAHVRTSPHDAYVGSVVRYIDEELSEGGRLFVHGSEAGYYFLTGRHYPWPFPQLYPGQEGGDGGRALVALLRRQPPALIVQSLQRLPGLPHLASYAPELDAHVRENFTADDGAFRRYPPPPGFVPAHRHFAVLRPTGR